MQLRSATRKRGRLYCLGNYQVGWDTHTHRRKGILRADQHGPFIIRNTTIVLSVIFLAHNSICRNKISNVSANVRSLKQMKDSKKKEKKVKVL